MKSPKISVLLSVYNSSRFLSETIESILNQSFVDFELIIIDDGSTDNSLKIIKEYQKKDKRIRVISNKKNLGLTRSLNKELKIAKGKYIARIDAGDLVLKERLEKQINFLEKHQNVFLLGAGVIKINEDGKKINSYHPKFSPKRITKILSKRNILYHSSIFFRNKEFFYRNKFYYAQDYDFYLRLLSNGKKIACIPDALIKYRITNNSISLNKKVQQKAFADKAREFYQQRINFGKDNYNNFNPETILFMKVKQNSREAIKAKIKKSFTLCEYNTMKKAILLYFKKYGISFRFLLYYLMSLLGKKGATILRRLFNF